MELSLNLGVESFPKNTPTGCCHKNRFLNRASAQRSAQENLLFLGGSGGFLGTVTAAGLAAAVNAGSIKGTADDLVTNTREVADTTAANQNDRVFLKFMTLTRDVNGHFFPIGKTDTGDAAECGIRLFGLHRTNKEANAALLRAFLQNNRLAEAVLLLPVLANQLVNGGH